MVTHGCPEPRTGKRFSNLPNRFPPKSLVVSRATPCSALYKPNREMRAKRKKPHGSTPAQPAPQYPPLPVDDPVSIAALILAAIPLVRDGVVALRHLLHNRSPTNPEKNMAAAVLTDIDRVDANARALREFLVRNDFDQAAPLDPGSFAGRLTPYEHRKFSELVGDCLSSVRAAFRHGTSLSGRLEARNQAMPGVGELRETVAQYNQLRFSKTYSDFFEGIDRLSATLRGAMSDLGLASSGRPPKDSPPKSSPEIEKARDDMVREVHEAAQERRRLLGR